MKKLFNKMFRKDKAEVVEEVPTYDPTWMAYNILLNALHDKKALKADLRIAMEEAVGYLGEEMDEHGIF